MIGYSSHKLFEAVTPMTDPFPTLSPARPSIDMTGHVISNKTR
jgi:hypothetical protein